MDNNATQVRNFKDVLLAGSLLLSVCVVGLMINAAAMITVRLNPFLKGSFGILCISQSVANFGTLLVYLIWVTPLILMQKPLDLELAGKAFGQSLILFWNADLYSHLAIAINRLIAIAFVHRNTTILTTRKTALTVTLLWLMGFCHAAPYFWVNTCYLVYDPAIWSWIFAETQCGYIISHYSDLYSTYALCAAMLLVDVATLIKLKFSHQSAYKSAFKTAQKPSVRRSAEMRFVAQVMLQSTALFYLQISVYFMSRISDGQWWMFITSTLSPTVYHSVDGLILLLFHFHATYRHFNQKTITVHSAINSRSISRISKA